MAAWSGFTDEDLRKMRSTSQEGDDDDRQGAPSKRGMARRPRGHATASRQKTDRSAAPSVMSSSSQPQILRNDERLSVSADKCNSTKDAVSKGDKSTKNNAFVAEDECESGIGSKTTASSSPKAVGQENMPQSEVVELSTDQAMSKEIDNAVKFQQQQKVIEEANKQKRALLSKAIEERRKMAKAEAQKLVKIQQELNHLDTLLNADVGIIRDRIEVASLDYAQAQKRYERAEKEFIEAKMDLFEKSEAKEKLTEHLYTIINQNEVRKAKKLVELMEQLAMQISPEEMELSMPSIPQLTNFTAASTIHQPGSHSGGAGDHVRGAHMDGNKGSGGVESGAAEDGNCKTADVGDGDGNGCGSSGSDTAIVKELSGGETNANDKIQTSPFTNNDKSTDIENSNTTTTTKVIKSESENQSSESKINYVNSSSVPNNNHIPHPVVESGSVMDSNPVVSNTPTVSSSQSQSSIPNSYNNNNNDNYNPAITTEHEEKTNTDSNGNQPIPLSTVQAEQDVTKAKGWSLPFT